MFFLGKLDSVLAMEDDFDDKSDGLASVRRRPLSRRLTSREVEVINKIKYNRRSATAWTEQVALKQYFLARF